MLFFFVYVLLQPYLVGHLVSELVALYANTAAATTFRNCVLHARALGLLLSLSLSVSVAKILIFLS